ncbi:conserved hypothetical protein [Allomeiothermus silvanus DSM 9946]|uniref:Uncharacterized protein n=2 Tax=Allomeiothermus silvanus TaxID=52022 RepID=D7BGI2_ALLS1|nr:conserved hypothetical protein [Allomeiothermus silvanus DSM 9946]
MAQQHRGLQRRTGQRLGGILTSAVGQQESGRYQGLFAVPQGVV